MARTLTTLDAHAIVNAVSREMFGLEESTQNLYSFDFVSVGERILAAGTENVINALSLVLGRTMIAVRPYEAKLKIINALNSGVYANRIRKISYLTRPTQPTGASNTQLFTNLAETFTNGQNGTDAITGDPVSTKSMWEQNQPKPIEVNFAGSSEWQESTTVYEYQLKQAFRSEEDFIRFVEGVMTVKANDIEQHKEAFNRLALLNLIAGGIYLNQNGDIDGSVINMTEAFNTAYGTAYTSAELLSTYIVEFTEFFVATVKTVLEEMSHNSAKFHYNYNAEQDPGSDLVLLRHTPVSEARFLMISDLWHKVEAMVKPQVFNTEYLDIGNFESVLYWQNFNNPYEISVSPAIPDFTTGEQTAPIDSAVIEETVIGCIFDRDALMTDYQLEAATSTPLEARKHYRNVWWTFRQNLMCDFSENHVIFIMRDEEGEGD